MDFQLGDGRTITLGRLGISSTYAGLLEGTPEGASAFYRRRGLGERIRSEFGAGRLVTIHVLDPKSPALPPVTWTAHFKSFQKTAPDVWYTELIVAWFAETFEGDVRSVVAAAIRDLDWSAHASAIRYDDV
jgi:hypothetical protein